MNCKAILFDMDGLLLDSEGYSAQAWLKAAQKRGDPVDMEMILGNCGRNRPSSIQYFKDKLGADFDYDGLVNESRRQFDCLFAGVTIPLKPYAKECLQALHNAGRKLALATSTREESARQSMSNLGVMGYFDAACFGGEVQNGKPAPDIFLLAAKKLGVAPEDCAVLEDSGNGIFAAKAAGMQALWVPDLLKPESHPEIGEAATMIFPSLKEATAWLL